MNTQQSRKIGLIVPSSNTIMEPDFYQNLPEGVSLHTARMFLEDVTAETEARMLDEFTLPAARDLATIQPDVIVFGCTSAGALRGNQYEAEMIEEISKVGGAPTISVSKSVRETLRKANASRLVVVTPYIDELTLRIRASLEGDGFEVLNIEGLGIQENMAIALVPGDEILAFAKRAVGNLNPDALFVSCTNFPAVNMLPELRRTFPFPVISSNQAVLERTLDALG